MEPIDVAAERLKLLIPEIAGYKDTIHSEEDTRLKVVDRVLTEILGWAMKVISTEERTGSGYVDYKLTVGGFARLVVEAKRDGRELTSTSLVENYVGLPMNPDLGIPTTEQERAAPTRT